MAAGDYIHPKYRDRVKHPEPSPVYAPPPVDEAEPTDDVAPAADGSETGKRRGRGGKVAEDEDTSE